MSTVPVVQDDYTAEVEQILSKITRQQNSGGAEGHLCDCDGKIVKPARVATCSPRGLMASFGLRTWGRDLEGWSAKKTDITPEYIEDDQVVLWTKNEPLGLCLRL